MRAIDADALVEFLTTAIRNMQGVAKFIGAEDDPEIKMEIKAYTDILNGVKDMPTIEPETVRINLNEKIKVKLTDLGKNIYYHQYDRTNQIAGREVIKPSYPKEDENGYTEFQLWCFMELYGTCMGITLPNVIEPLEIVYGGDEG